jgi:two-component system, OmpR family, phosphate regulon response regulator OmpR
MNNKIINRILIVDDDSKLRVLLSKTLRSFGFLVYEAEDSISMHKMLERKHIHLIVLDLMLPGEDGLSICQSLRTAKNDVPIIMLTARGDDIDKIIGLEIGADDYLPKPCNPRELVARIKSILRRNSNNYVYQLDEFENQVFTFGDFKFDRSTRKLTKIDKNLSLTSGMYALLSIFVRNPRVPMSRDRLVEMIYGDAHQAYERRIDIQISRLRKLIEDDPSDPKYIKTVWGVGYSFIPDQE